MIFTLSKREFAPDSEFYYNLLHVISEPLESIDNFKLNILKCLQDSFNAPHFWFYEAININNSNKNIIFTNPTVINAASETFDEKWLNERYKTCVYNPNKNSLFLNSAKRVFKFTDFMTEKEYENNINYQEILRPNDYYYSLVSFLKLNGSLLGLINMQKSKRDGDYTKEEIDKFESISSFITNRLLDYREADNIRYYQQLFSGVIDESPDALILLSDSYSIIKYNTRAAELSIDILGNSENVNNFAHTLVDKVVLEMIKNKKYFYEVRKDKTSFNIAIYPYFISNKKCGFDPAYLVHLSRSNDINRKPYFSVYLNAGLTNREVEIIEFMGKGLTNTQIAGELMISSNTVRKHIENIHKKVGATNRVAVLQKLGKIS